MPLLICPETTADHDAIRHVHSLAFARDDEGRLVDALGDHAFSIVIVPLSWVTFTFWPAPHA
jgi:hypothetical protein